MDDGGIDEMLTEIRESVDTGEHKCDKCRKKISEHTNDELINCMRQVKFG